MLGLRRGSSERAVARRYRLLVKRWHPDQYANDPQGFEDATIRMRAINDAYAAVKAAGFRPVPHGAPRVDHQSGHQTPPVHSHLTLTPEQIDEIAGAIGTKSFVDDLLDLVSWAWPFPFALIFWLRVIGLRRPTIPLRPTERWWPLVLVLLGVGLWLRRVWRSRDASRTRGTPEHKQH